MMKFERIMGIQVTDDDLYQKYREAMLPILTEYGGFFGYDFKVSQVLKAKTNEPINRVFTIEFPSQEVMDAFFSDADYLAVKNKFFNPSVTSVTVISLHEKI